jgi:hypothetical protein
MCTKILLAVVLVLAMTGIQACTLSGPIRYWNDEGAQVNDPNYGQSESTHRSCDSNGKNCAGCDANNNNCGRFARATLFVW